VLTILLLCLVVVSGLLSFGVVVRQLGSAWVSQPF
jgi:hypothetical protein